MPIPLGLAAASAGGIVLTAAKPIAAAAGLMFLFDRAGVDLTSLPLVGGFIADGAEDDVDDDLELGVGYFCFLGRRRKKKNNMIVPQTKSGIRYVIPTVMGGVFILDIFLGGVLLSSTYFIVDQPLKQWLFGALLLGFPTTALIDKVSRKVSFKHAFLVETFALFVGFAWLSYGMLIISQSTAFRTAPLLFWSIFSLCVGVWSVMGTVMLGTILAAVVTLLFGQCRALQEV